MACLESSSSFDPESATTHAYYGGQDHAVWCLNADRNALSRVESRGSLVKFFSIIDRRSAYGEHSHPRPDSGVGHRSAGSDLIYDQNRWAIGLGRIGVLIEEAESQGIERDRRTSATKAPLPSVKPNSRAMVSFID